MPTEAMTPDGTFVNEDGDTTAFLPSATLLQQEDEPEAELSATLLFIVTSEM